MKTQFDLTLPAIPAASYPVWIGTTLLESVSLWLPKGHSNIVIITDHHVQKYYAALLEKALQEAGYPTALLVFPAGEAFKTITTKCQLEEEMLALGCDRETLILALGGGVVGDMAGFVAATYMRGIDYIAIPTTLLAMVDSSIGGKTGIDTPQGKNLIGAFWQPKAVIADITCLQSLSKTMLVQGLIEAIKLFLVSDANAFYNVNAAIERFFQHDENALTSLIEKAIILKAEVVSKDEREQHQRSILNLGHTIGHALEHLSNYQLPHGYAVALGLLVEAKIAQLMGFFPLQDYQHLKALLYRLHIDPQDLFTWDMAEVLKSTQSDKKKQGKAVRYVLLTGIGSVYKNNQQFAHPVSDTVVEQAFSCIKKEVQDERK